MIFIAQIFFGAMKKRIAIIKQAYQACLFSNSLLQVG